MKGTACWMPEWRNGAYRVEILFHLPYRVRTLRHGGQTLWPCWVDCKGLHLIHNALPTRFPSLVFIHWSKRAQMLSPLIPTSSEIEYQLAHARDDRSSQIIVSHAICLPLATFAVILRLVSRSLCKAARLRADDFTIIVALVLFSFGFDA